MASDVQTRPQAFDDRYRLYIDESGDHVYRMMATASHQHLCLLGCWFQNPDYLSFHEALEQVKKAHFAHHPDRPVVFHREDMINARREFKSLQDPAVRAAVDENLLSVIENARFTVVAVVIDKYELWRKLGDAAPHPYSLGLVYLLQRYVGFLNHVGRRGDVMAEARGATEDRLLGSEFSRLHTQGGQYLPAHAIQAALTSNSLKLRQKSANISGLQLADMLGHPVKQWVLRKKGYSAAPMPRFAERLMEVVEPKLNRNLYQNRVDGYGYVVYPKK